MTSDNQPILFETFALPRELLVALAAIFNTNATGEILRIADRAVRPTRDPAYRGSCGPGHT